MPDGRPVGLGTVLARFLPSKPQGVHTNGEKEWLDDLQGKVTVNESTSASPGVTKLNLERCSVEEAVTSPIQSAKSSLKCTACPAIFTSVNGLRRQESIAMHHCPVQGCGQRNPRDDKVHSQMQQTHSLIPRCHHQQEACPCSANFHLHEQAVQESRYCCSSRGDRCGQATRGQRGAADKTT